MKALIRSLTEAPTSQISFKEMQAFVSQKVPSLYWDTMVVDRKGVMKITRTSTIESKSEMVSGMAGAFGYSGFTKEAQKRFGDTFKFSGVKAKDNGEWKTVTATFTGVPSMPGKIQ